jgi:2-polyprenyl-3-methyl-5-hydroxy-6-metoxy-1,4-benzoquinol methylase
MKKNLSCWCGSTNLERFSEEYLRCPDCDTLVWEGKNDVQDISQPTSEDNYYGRRYWYEHQELELDLPDIDTRARSDLTGRCLYWMEVTLKYRLPPAKVLDLGSSHGGFVALLRYAGYDSTGLEVSSWITEYARRMFNIPVLEGSIEGQELPPGSFDVIALMDVLEHLPAPEQTMRRCLDLLKEDGLLLVQTPCYPTGESLHSLKGKNHPFLKMLIPREHVHLFSQGAVQKLLGEVGELQVWFERAFFSEHDMFLAASRKPLQVNAPEMIEEHLLSSPGGRIVLALLDLSGQTKRLNQQLAEVETDRAARLDLIHKLNEQLEIVEADRAARLDVIMRLDAQVKELSRRLENK